MNRSELVDALAKRTDLPRRVSDAVVTTVFDAIFDELATGGRVEIRGFGSFTTRRYESYVGRNPRTGASVRVEPKRLPFFKVGKDLRDRLL